MQSRSLQPDKRSTSHELRVWQIQRVTVGGWSGAASRRKPGQQVQVDAIFQERSILPVTVDKAFHETVRPFDSYGSGVGSAVVGYLQQIIPQRGLVRF